jgi:hypothetical protein
MGFFSCYRFHFYFMHLITFVNAGVGIVSYIDILVTS